MRTRRFWWNVIRPFWLSIRWPAIAALALLAVILGYIGFDSYFEARGTSPSSWDKLYFSLQLFGLQSEAVEPPIPAALQVARLLAPLVAAYAAISALASIFRDQIGQTRVRWFALDHVVVCGLGRTGHLLARAFREQGQRVVALEKDSNAAAITECRETGITVLVGDAADRSLLARARADRARYLFAVSDDDGANAQIAIHARDLVKGRRRAPLTCYVQVIGVDLAELLDAEMARRGTSDFRLEFFNPAERGAPALLNEYPPFDERGGTLSGPPHVLVVGLGEMGSRLVLHTARRWRAIVGENGGRLRVSVVDDDADHHVDSLAQHHPQLTKICEFFPHRMNVDSPEFERAEFLFDLDGRNVTVVYVCLGDDAHGLAAALRLCRRIRGRGVLIVVRTMQHGGLGTLLGDTAGEYEDLRVFGLLDLVCRPDVLLSGGRTEVLARAIHEQYVRKASEEGQTPEKNPSMVSWDRLPEKLRESNRRQADHIGIKLQTIGCDIEPLVDWSVDSFAFTSEEIELLAPLEHDRWWRERVSEGWTYAPTKDIDAQKSPYLVPWEELPENARELDRDAVRGIPAFLARAGFRMVRLQRNGK